MIELEPNADVALLAPVPEQHLLSALAHPNKDQQVAFGSEAAITLLTFQHELGADGIADVLIYASERPVKGFPKATYRARWVRFEGAVPPGKSSVYAALRPPSTALDGTWSGFWIVSNLRKLSDADAVEIKSLSGHNKQKKFAGNFIPIGPIIINTPF